MFTEKRLARKRAANERLKLMMAQEELTEKYCSTCPLRNDHLDPTQKCKGCEGFVKLREIGEKLDNVNLEKRKFCEFEEPEEEKVMVHTGDFLKAEKYLTCTQAFHDNLGNIFKKGDRFIQKKNMQGNKIEVVSADGKIILLTQHRYYKSFKGIKIEEFLVPRTEYRCNKTFVNKQGVLVSKQEVWNLTDKHTSKSYRILQKDVLEIKISKDTFYRNFDRETEAIK